MSDIPAFPTTQYANGISPTGHDNGMTLRDYFAAKAMQGIVNNSDAFWAGAAPLAYQYADAMMKAREV